MTLTRSRIEKAAAEYSEEGPLHPVEEEAIETYPAAFAEGEFGWRDAEWVVQWYYRRYLGAYPQDRQRTGEELFAENERGAVRSTIGDVVATDGLEDRIARLRTLEGVDLPVASAFLQFIDPHRYVAVDGRTWRILHGAGELDEPYPGEPSVAEYRRFLEVCRGVADREGVDCWTLYRALWRLGSNGK